MIVITQLPSTAEEINTELNTLRDFYIKKSKVYDFASAKVVNNLIFNHWKPISHLEYISKHSHGVPSLYSKEPLRNII